MLSGQYPTGTVNWGASAWYLAAPWGLFNTNSIGFNGPGPTSGTLTFVAPHRLIQLDAYNGSPTASTITLSCLNQPTRTFTLAAAQLATLTLDWSAPCPSVTITSTNGWNTNFDTLLLE